MATPTNPFEGMTFSQATEAAKANQVQGNTNSESPKADNPFAGLRFSDVAKERRTSEEGEMSDAMRTLLGRPARDQVQDQQSQEVAEFMEEEGGVRGADEARQAQKAASNREQAREVQREFAGETSGFVSGRDQIPLVIDNPTKERVRQEIEAGNEEFMHRVKYFGQSVVMNTADLVDFVREAPSMLNPFNYIEGFGEAMPSSVEIDGQTIKLDQNFHDTAGQLIKDTYEVLGGAPELERARDAGDIFLNLLGGNVGASAIIGGGVKGVQKLSDKASDLTKFLKAEMKVNVVGASAGTGIAEIAGGSIEDREGIAMVGNMAGILGFEILRQLPSVQAGKAVVRKMAKTRDLFESDDAYGMAQDRVLKYLGSFVPKTEVGKIEQRMELVRRIQRLEKDFKPTVGNIIGTEETRMIQRITDSKNYAKADTQYQATKAAVERLTLRLSEETDPTQKGLILEALRMYSDDTLAHAQRIQDQISTVDAAARRVKGGDIAGSRAGEGVREQLNGLKQAYEDTMDTIYKGIDPEGTARFDARGLISRVKSIADDTSDLERILDVEDTGYNFISRVLPKFITKTAKRSSDEVPEGLEALGFILPGAGGGAAAKTAPKEVPYLTFEELKKLNTNVRKRAVKIKRQDPSSNAPRILNDIAEQLDDMISTKMLSGDPEVKTRFLKATQFAADQFYPRFTQGVGGKLLREDPNTGDYFVRGDEIGPMFWKSGAKESNIEDFQKLFSREHAELNGMSKSKDPDEFKVAAEAASEVGRDYLKSFAMRTLQDEMDRLPGTSPLSILEKWKTKYNGALSTFKEVADEIDVLEIELRGVESARRANTSFIQKMNREVIERYSGIEESTILDSVFKGTTSVEDVGRLVDDIYRGTARKVSLDETEVAARATGKEIAKSQPNVGPAGFESLYPPIERINMSTPEIVRIQTAMRDSVTSELISRAYDPALEGPSWSKFDKLIKDKRMRAKLEKIYDEETLKGVDDFGQALRLMGSENKPITLKELNTMKDFMNKMGFSPASVLSRYYSHALGKVGPMYLAADAFTRLFTGVSQRYFDRVYADVMYDLNGLEMVLKHTGAEDSAQFIEKTKAMLKKQTVEGLKALGTGGMKKLFSDHAFANYGRGLNFFEDLEEAQENRSHEESVQNLTRWYLEMNDDKTGQPSRIQDSAHDRDSLLEEDDIFTDFEENEDNPEQTYYQYMNETFNGGAPVTQKGRDSGTLTDVGLGQQQTAESSDDVEYVAGVVQDIFEEAGLDPETGLIFAQLESSMGKFTKAPTSSAEGVFQFIDSTWESMVEKHGSKYGITMENADKFDPEQNAYMGAEFLKENAASLERKGHEATPENLYLAHFLGAGGANRFLKGLKEKPNAPVSKSVRKSQIEANKSLFIKKGKLVTLEEFMDTISNKVDTARGNIQSYLDTGTSNTAEA